MKFEAFNTLMKSLERIDGGRTAPRLSGSIGRFLRNYESQRNDFTKLAIQRGVTVNRNGEIPGDGIGSISLFPLTSLVSGKSVSTHYGGFFSYAVLCPELVSIIDLRLWTHSGSGSSGLNLLESLTEDEGGLTLTGGFRWIPPLRITPGAGDFDVLPRPANDLWATLDFLKYVGEDIASDPFPLEYRPLWLNAEPLLASIRVAAGVITQKGRLVVPYAVSDRSTELKLESGDFTTARARTIMTKEGGCTCLLIREPHEDAWWIWDAIESSPEDLLTHLLSWTTYVDGLRPDPKWGDEDYVVSAALSSLSLIDVDPRRPVDVPSSSFPAYDFALELSRLMRFTVGSRMSSQGYVK